MRCAPNAGSPGGGAVEGHGARRSSSLGRDLRLAAELSERDDKVSVAQRIEFRRGHAYAVRLCVGAINDLYDVVGGTGISLNNGVQRAWRDINAVAHHISVNWHAVSTMYGQMRLGLPPRGQY